MPNTPNVIETNNWLPAVTALVVFLIAFGIPVREGVAEIVKGLDDREKKIRDEIAAAEAAREQAKAALAEYQDSLAQAREEASQMIAKARADAKAVADELRSRNESRTDGDEAARDARDRSRPSRRRSARSACRSLQPRRRRLPERSCSAKSTHAISRCWWMNRSRNWRRREATDAAWPR